MGGVGNYDKFHFVWPSLSCLLGSSFLVEHNRELEKVSGEGVGVGRSDVEAPNSEEVVWYLRLCHPKKVKTYRDNLHLR